ncbi:MAG: dienelactone hydrolase family protein [Sphingomonadaceae bacterium]|nr:dienelactone hydrolase family protein [Sphingomonadaceae bacterium]
MRRRLFVTAMIAALLLPKDAGFATSVAQPPNRAEMPELSGRGPLAIGTRQVEFKNVNRTIGLRFWYPAEKQQKASDITYQHTRSVSGQQSLQIHERGYAILGAKPDQSSKFPLVLISHGYGGWAEHMSQLGEALSSHGYVVASIDHRDPPFHDGASFAASFGSVLLNRATDQQSALREICQGRLKNNPAVEQLDCKNIAIIGFSMGGYGALTTAGIGLDAQAPAYLQMPPAMRAALPKVDLQLAQSIKAVVAMAPWGAQPSANVWAEKDLAAFATPLLLIGGDQDDVVNFREGISRLFAGAQSSDRYMLVYREAAHNIAGNPVALPSNADFSSIEYVSDPVWRKERIEAINQHFIRAFLDIWLKNNRASRAYLNVPTRISNEGQWPSAFGQQWGGMVAGDKQPGYWRGFQRRWARGLELHHKSAGE